MDERPRKPPNDDDVPIIGDYSEAANARIRAESPPVPPPEHARAEWQPTPTHAPTRPTEDQWRVDPRDVHRHAKLKQQRERVGPFSKILRYGLVAVVLVAAFFVYQNFETLRSVEIDFSAITDLFSDRSGSDASGTPRAAGDAKTNDFAPPQVVGVDAPTSVGDAQPPAASVAETPAARSELPTTQSAEIAPPPAVATAKPSPDASPASSRPAPPAAAPELPPGPESFEFGLSTVSVSEADASAHVIILRNGDRRRASSITWWTEDGTAKAGLDYANLGRVAEKFAAGEQNRTIHIPIIGDHKTEGPEMFYVHLAPSEDADPTVELVQKLEVIINDD